MPVKPTTAYSVNLNGGANAAASGGSTTQIGLTGPMKTVTYTADTGYRFNAFNDISQNGVTAARTNEIISTVSFFTNDFILSIISQFNISVKKQRDANANLCF